MTLPDLTSSIVLIVIENGAAWPRWVDRCRADAGAFARSSRVLIQDEGESPAGFAARVGSYVTELGSDRIAIAAIACGERADANALEARRMIGSHLARAMSNQKCGRICFSEPSHANGRVRQALVAIASDLEQQWSECGLELGVRFSSDNEPSSRVA